MQNNIGSIIGIIGVVILWILSPILIFGAGWFGG